MIEIKVIDTWVDQLVLRVQAEYESSDFKQKVTFSFETDLEEDSNAFTKKVLTALEQKRLEYEDILSKQDGLTLELKESDLLKIK